MALDGMSETGWRLFLCLATARLFLGMYRYLGKVGEMQINTVQINPRKEGGYTQSMYCHCYTNVKLYHNNVCCGHKMFYVYNFHRHASPHHRSFKLRPSAFSAPPRPRSPQQHSDSTITTRLFPPETAIYTCHKRYQSRLTRRNQHTCGLLVRLQRSTGMKTQGLRVLYVQTAVADDVSGGRLVRRGMSHRHALQSRMQNGSRRSQCDHYQRQLLPRDMRIKLRRDGWAWIATGRKVRWLAGGRARESP